jgi:hypothetical protein
MTVLWRLLSKKQRDTVDYNGRQWPINIIPTSFPGLSCEDERREEKALVWQLLVKEWRNILT